MSFVYGLVPPPVENVAQQCTNGVSRVETQHSFLNGLVAALSAGIVTPLQIDVICAAAGGNDDLARVHVPGNPREALLQAIAISRATGKPVLAQF
jgi:hypothetical protein